MTGLAAALVINGILEHHVDAAWPASRFEDIGLPLKQHLSGGGRFQARNQPGGGALAAAALANNAHRLSPEDAEGDVPNGNRVLVAFGKVDDL